MHLEISQASQIGHVQKKTHHLSHCTPPPTVLPWVPCGHWVIPLFISLHQTQILEVILDTSLTLTAHLLLSQSHQFLKIPQIDGILLSIPTATSAVQGFIILSPLDYSNGFLTGPISSLAPSNSFSMLLLRWSFSTNLIKSLLYIQHSSWLPIG